MRDIAERLKEARQRVGKSTEQLAGEAGMSLPSYYDLEAGQDWFNAVSIAQISAIAQAVGMTFAELMCGDSRRDNQPTSERDLQSRLRAALSESHTDIPEFEKRLGWNVGPFLKDPQAVRDWNIDCLRAVCQQLGINWCSFSLSNVDVDRVRSG
jgi:transcriptional regulator with XRE-family HTH domain